jgi:hypothetical protein
MDFWTTDRRGAVEIATFSNPPHNYLGQPVIDELGQLVTDWQDPDIRAVVIQSKPQALLASRSTASKNCTEWQAIPPCLAMRALSSVVTRQFSIA